MNRIIKDFKVILSEENQEKFKESVISLAQAETKMALEQEQIPLDFFLDYGTLVSSFFNMYHSQVRMGKGISYVSFHNRLEHLQEISVIMRGKENESVKLIGQNLKYIYLKLSEITKATTIGNLP
jgi:hypothetical protein